MKVQKRKKTTEALLWTDGANKDEFERLVGQHCNAVLYETPDYGRSARTVLVIDGYSDHKGKYRDIYLYQNDWLVVRSDGKATVMDDEVFRAKYEEK